MLLHKTEFMVDHTAAITQCAESTQRHFVITIC